jgi:hypothetical protein
MTTPDDHSVDKIFNGKYTEFCDELVSCYPEKKDEITAARALTERERLERFRAEVMPIAGRPMRDATVTPGIVLPGVMIEPNHWAEFSETTKAAIQQYVTLLSFCCMFGEGMPKPWAAGTEGPSKAWMEEMMNHWKTKLNGLDFASLSEKMMKMFNEGGAKGGFKLPERLLKGQLAKLADELVKEFDPKDFGLTPEQLEETEKNPSRAFELLMNIYTQKPELLQNAMKRIARRLQEKVQRGELRPADLAREAEEMMKDFAENPAMMEMMETFRGVFGFENQETARAAGRDGENRLSIARNRLRAKLEAKKAGRTADASKNKKK